MRSLKAGTILCAILMALSSAWPIVGAEPSPISSDAAALTHVLNRITYGARPEDLERIRKIGVSAYIDEQLRPVRLDDKETRARLARLTTIGMSTRELAEQFFIPALVARRERKREEAKNDEAGPGTSMRSERERPRPESSVLIELAEQRLLRAVYDERQLQEVLVDFWFNHFNVFAGKGATRLYLTEYERDTIRPHAMGNFRELLGAVAASPAMLFYLDNWMSTDPNATAERRERPRRLIGQQPPARSRGLNENYARELMELHTLGVDGGYTQKDVIEVARAFTGWTIEMPRAGGGFRFDSRIHDSGEKVVLGQVIRAGGGKQDGDRVLDILASHPSTARFIASKLARRFVADDPPAPLVDRAAARFQETRGDIGQVVRAILFSPEFFAPAARRAKIKTPVEFVVSALRATDATVDRAAHVTVILRELGMPIFFAQPPTGYPDRADAWVNSGALVNRMNFAVGLLANRIRGVSLDLRALAGPGDLTEIRNRLIDRLLPGEISNATMATLMKAQDAQTMGTLMIGSPEFQKR